MSCWCGFTSQAHTRGSDCRMLFICVMSSMALSQLSVPLNLHQQSAAAVALRWVCKSAEVRVQCVLSCGVWCSRVVLSKCMWSWACCIASPAACSKAAPACPPI